MTVTKTNAIRILDTANIAREIHRYDVADGKIYEWKALSYLDAPLRDAYTRWQKFLIQKI